MVRVHVKSECLLQAWYEIHLRMSYEDWFYNVLWPQMPPPPPHNLEVESVAEDVSVWNAESCWDALNWSSPTFFILPWTERKQKTKKTHNWWRGLLNDVVLDRLDRYLIWTPRPTTGALSGRCCFRWTDCQNDLVVVLSDKMCWPVEWLPLPWWDTVFGKDHCEQKLSSEWRDPPGKQLVVDCLFCGGWKSCGRLLVFQRGGVWEVLF